MHIEPALEAGSGVMRISILGMQTDFVYAKFPEKGSQTQG